MFKFRLSLLALCTALSACQGVPQHATHTAATPTLLVSGRLPAVASAQLLPPLPFMKSMDRLQVTKAGVQLIDQAGRTSAQLVGKFETLDHRADDTGLLVATLDKERQQALLVRVDESRLWSARQYLPKTSFAIEGMCLYRDHSRNDFLFVIGEDGIGEQWLVAKGGHPLAEPRKVRALSFPPESAFCQVDDASDSLLINEEGVGLWHYAAGAEAPLVRRPVDMRAPFGSIAGAVAGMAIVPHGVLVLDPDASALHLYEHGADAYKKAGTVALHGFNEPEQISARPNAKGLDVLIVDDEGAQRATIDWQPTGQPAPPSIPELTALIQTETVPSLGDAADDPAIWVNPKDPAQSRVLGTDKKGGLLAYDLTGKQLQDLRVGRINNVDIRRGFRLGDKRVDLAVATNRDHNSLHLFAIDPATGHVSEIGEVATPLKEIYGLCLFKDFQGEIYAIANDKNGTFLQYRLDGSHADANGHLVRSFRTATQPEGCVADDENQQLYIGEEDVAVWALDARPEAPADLQRVISAGDTLHADIEGLAIYKGSKKDYLVISSQGNSSYVVIDAQAPYLFRGNFRVNLNSELGIDGASETDGLAVTSSDLGGPWSKGMLVVQDGRKRMPEGSQNFKYVPWTAIADTLGLE